MQLFLIRGLVAIAWAAVFAAVSDSLTTGVTVAAGILVRDLSADRRGRLVDRRAGQRGSARRLLLAGAAVSALAAAALAAPRRQRRRRPRRLRRLGARQWCGAVRRRPAPSCAVRHPVADAARRRRVRQLRHRLRHRVDRHRSDAEHARDLRSRRRIDFVVQAWLLARRRRRPGSRARLITHTGAAPAPCPRGPARIS